MGLVEEFTGIDYLTEFIGLQEPLGEEFYKVLAENLWDLYDTDK